MQIRPQTPIHSTTAVRIDVGLRHNNNFNILRNCTDAIKELNLTELSKISQVSVLFTLGLLGISLPLCWAGAGTLCWVKGDL